MWVQILRVHCEHLVDLRGHLKRLKLVLIIGNFFKVEIDNKALPFYNVGTGRSGDLC